VFDLPDAELRRLGSFSRRTTTTVPVVLKTMSRALEEAAEVVERAQYHQEVPLPPYERRPCVRYAEHGLMFIEQHDLVCIKCGYREPAVGNVFHATGLGLAKIMKEVPVS